LGIAIAPLDTPTANRLHTVFFHKKKWSDPPTEQDSTTGQTQTTKGQKTLMDKQNLMPQAAQPVNRITTGQLPAELAELSEEALQLHGDSANAAAVFASNANGSGWSASMCSYDGDDAE